MANKKLDIGLRVRIVDPVSETIKIDNTRKLIPVGDYIITAITDACKMDICEGKCNGAVVLDSKYPFCYRNGHFKIAWLKVLPIKESDEINIFKVL